MFKFFLIRTGFTAATIMIFIVNGKNELYNNIAHFFFLVTLGIFGFQALKKWLAVYEDDEMWSKKENVDLAKQSVGMFLYIILLAISVLCAIKRGTIASFWGCIGVALNHYVLFKFHLDHQPENEVQNFLYKISLGSIITTPFCLLYVVYLKYTYWFQFSNVVTWGPALISYTGAITEWIVKLKAKAETESYTIKSVLSLSLVIIWIFLVCAYGIIYLTCLRDVIKYLVRHLPEYLYWDWFQYIPNTAVILVIIAFALFGFPLICDHFKKHILATQILLTKFLFPACIFYILFFLGIWIGYCPTSV